MILVRYTPGSLGNFFSSVLINFKKNSNFLDYGGNKINSNSQNILHLYDELDWEAEQRIKKRDYKIVNCNYAVSDNLLEQFVKNKYQIIFIELKSNFIEYRLNYLYKHDPKYLKNSNDIFKKYHKRVFSYPDASYEAIRIFRLYQNVEQLQVKKLKDDIVFDFSNFYIKPFKSWKINFIELGKKINYEIADLDFWYESFQGTQKPILIKTAQIKESIKEKKFLFNFSENEKGIVLGEYCLHNSIEENRFDEIYNKFSK
tara:strand:+ start:135 stop:908 length:774 start_codon:yes stop_codon:yes gene_type:complete